MMHITMGLTLLNCIMASREAHADCNRASDAAFLYFGRKTFIPHAVATVQPKIPANTASLLTDSRAPRTLVKIGAEQPVVTAQMLSPTEREARDLLAQIYFGYRPLSTRLQQILNKIPEPLSSIELNKCDIKLLDIAAMTAATGNEFALFTKANHRLIYRGSRSGVRLPLSTLQEIKELGYRFALHSHPGITELTLLASGIPGDREVLQIFEQRGSFVVNSVGMLCWYDQKQDRILSITMRDAPRIDPSLT